MTLWILSILLVPDHKCDNFENMDDGICSCKIHPGWTGLNGNYQCQCAEGYWMMGDTCYLEDAIDVGKYVPAQGSIFLRNYGFNFCQIIFF